MKLGAHQSIAGGLYKSIQRASRIKLECLQIFTKSPQTWNEPEISVQQQALFSRWKQKAGYKNTDVIVHASYLVNTCSANPLTRKKAARALQLEAQRCDLLGIQYLVFHPGSPGQRGENEGISLISEAILDTLESTCNVHLLIENTAGTGKSIGHSFEQLQQILNSCENDRRVAICFDTAHAFAAGYNLAQGSVAQSTFSHFDDIIGLDKLKVFHLNDSRTKCGSRIDRHEQLGQGHIGMDFFHWLVNEQWLDDTLCILETPLEKNETYAKDISMLKRHRVKIHKKVPSHEKTD